MKQMSGNLALLAIALAVSFLLLEAGIRLFSPQTLNIYQYNEDYLFDFRPHAEIDYRSEEYSQFTKFNSHGFRDNEYDYENKPKNTYRIMVLGDSFVTGMEIPFNVTSTKIVETSLKKQFPKKNIEVLSAAVNGWSTEQELLFLEKKGMDYDPDMVVLAYYVGNDQIDNVGRRIFNYDGGKLSINEDRPLSQTRFRSIYYFFSSHFHSVNYMMSFYWKIRYAVTEEQTPTHEEAIAAYLQKNDSGSVGYSWSKTFALLDRMHSDLRQNNVTMVLLVIPDRVQYLSALRKTSVLNDSELVLDKPDKLLIGWAKSRNVEYVDLMPAFQAHSNETLHFQKDFHWNEAGHVLAASTTSTKLINYLSRVGFEDGKR